MNETKMRLVNDRVISYAGVKIVDLDEILIQIEDWEAFPIFNEVEVIRYVYEQLMHREYKIEEIIKVCIKFDLDFQVLSELKNELIHIFYVDYEKQKRCIQFEQICEFVKNSINQVASDMLSSLNDKL